MTTQKTIQSELMDTNEVTQMVLNRSRRRLRLWAGTAILLWILIAILMVSATYFYFIWIFPIQNEVVYQMINGAQPASAMADRYREMMPITANLFSWSALMGAVFLIAAAIVTLLYIRASNRANLTLIRSELAAISEQLRQLTCS